MIEACSIMVGVTTFLGFIVLILLLFIIIHNLIFKVLDTIFFDKKQRDVLFQTLQEVGLRLNKEEKEKKKKKKEKFDKTIKKIKGEEKDGK